MIHINTPSSEADVGVTDRLLFSLPLVNKNNFKQIISHLKKLDKMVVQHLNVEMTLYTGIPEQKLAF